MLVHDAGCTHGVSIKSVGIGMLGAVGAMVDGRGAPLDDEGGDDDNDGRRTRCCSFSLTVLTANGKDARWCLPCDQTSSIDQLWGLLVK